MTLETATYLSDLNASYPEGSSPANQLDDHIRLSKSAMKASFPNVDGACNFSPAEANLLVGASGVLRTSTSAPLAGELVLMKSTTISGGPSAVDFVHGSGGVTFSSAYDQYLVVLTNIRHASSTNAKLRMTFSQNAGSTYDAAAIQGVSYSQSGGTESTDDRSSIGYFPITAEQANASATTAPGIHAWVDIIRPADETDVMALSSRYVGRSVGAGAGGWALAYADAGAAIDAIRIAWDTGNFANTGTIALYGRKV